MLKITVELYPGGDPKRARVLGVMQIANIKINEDGTSDYKIIADENPNTVTQAPFLKHIVKIKGHKRKQSVYGLVTKAARVVATNFNRQVARKQHLEERHEKERDQTASQETK